MPTMQEEREIPSLNTLKAVTPINTKKGPGSVGDVALKDALIIIGACWLSLRASIAWTAIFRSCRRSLR